MSAWRHPGVAAALAAALLFGLGTPLAKLLLGPVEPWLLAGLFYLGSGVGLLVFRRLRRMPRVRVARGELFWLGGAIVAGGVLAPVLLLWGLAAMPAAGASLLLNAEGVFTALLAWFVFRENFDRRILLGFVLILGGALVLSWPSDARFSTATPALAVLAACFLWALDNNLTRKVALVDATFVAMTKGLVAGVVNCTLAVAFAAPASALPAASVALAAASVGFFTYGVSLVLFVRALRDLGTARTGAYFSTAPFVGAVIAIPLLGEDFTARLAVAGLLMAVGVWLHLTEHHEHEHTHESIEHAHEHVHDAHHRHDHAAAGDEPHTHWHRHEPLTHTHPHFPDAHHRHDHH